MSLTGIYAVTEMPQIIKACWILHVGRREAELDFSSEEEHEIGMRCHKIAAICFGMLGPGSTEKWKNRAKIFSAKGKP